MNILKKEQDIFGQCSSKKVYESMEKFLKITKETKRALGEKSYKLDNYLSILLKAINFKFNTDVANEGVDAYCELRGICLSVLNFDKKYKSHGFYQTAKDFIKTDRFKYKEKHTLLEIYTALLTPKFTDFVVEKYVKKLKQESSLIFKIVELEQLYEYLSNEVGKSKMDSLNNAIIEIFSFYPVVNSFLQSIVDHYLLCLLYRDEETSKQIFQLITD